MTNGSVTNSSASSTANCVNATLMPSRAVRAVEREQREAGDDRRQRERQVDQRVDERLPRNWSRTSTQAISVPVTALISRGDERDAEREAQRADRLAAA